MANRHPEQYAHSNCQRQADAAQRDDQGRFDTEALPMRTTPDETSGHRSLPQPHDRQPGSRYHDHRLAPACPSAQRRGGPYRGAILVVDELELIKDKRKDTVGFRRPRLDTPRNEMRRQPQPGTTRPTRPAPADADPCHTRLPPVPIILPADTDAPIASGHRSADLRLPTAQVVPCKLAIIPLSIPPPVGFSATEGLSSELTSVGGAGVGNRRGFAASAS